MDSAGLLARAELFALDSLAFYRKLSKGPEAQVPGVRYFHRVAEDSTRELES